MIYQPLHIVKQNTDDYWQMNRVCVCVKFSHDVTASFCSETRCTSTHCHEPPTVTLCRITIQPVILYTAQMSSSTVFLNPNMPTPFYSQLFTPIPNLLPGQPGFIPIPFPVPLVTPLCYHYQYPMTPVIILHQQCKAKLLTSKLHNERDSTV